MSVLGQVKLVCTGCGASHPDDAPLPFACPNREHGQEDHVLRAQFPVAVIREGFPNTALQPGENPFLRYRKLSYSWHWARSKGISDARYVEIVDTLSRAIAEVDVAPAITPCTPVDSLRVIIKNETINVSGSHKARHLIGTAIHLAVAQEVTENNTDSNRDLAIASCGNAALAAAVVAKAAGRSLRVFIPPNADPAVVAKLTALDAKQSICERKKTDPPGDPCYLQFRDAVVGGALPFSCQGGDNALALIGGHTLGWELIEQCFVGARNLPTDVFIQVGGGALASSIIQVFFLAVDAKLISALPRFHAVQTTGTSPLLRAWKALKDVDCDFEQARKYRSGFMWPWETVLPSIAGGILDDETYDWLSILRGVHESSGSVITVSEMRLRQALELGAMQSKIAVDATGTAGFAGVLEALASKTISDTSLPLVLFTGSLR